MWLPDLIGLAVLFLILASVAYVCAGCTGDSRIFYNHSEMARDHLRHPRHYFLFVVGFPIFFRMVPVPSQYPREDLEENNRSHRV